MLSAAKHPATTVPTEMEASLRSACRNLEMQLARHLVDVLTADDVVFTLTKCGDHRLSREADVARLIATCGEIVRMI